MPAVCLRCSTHVGSSCFIDHDGAAQSLATMSNRKRPPSEAIAERVAAFSVATVARAYSAAYELRTVVDRIVNS